MDGEITRDFTALGTTVNLTEIKLSPGIKHFLNIILTEI